MTKVRRWRPSWSPLWFSRGAPARNLVPRDIDDLLRGYLRNYFGDDEMALTDWCPSIDCVETPTAYEIKADVPGIDADDIHVTLTGDTLTLRGEKKSEERREEDHRVFVERSQGAFERSMQLPNAAAQDVEGDLKDGVLTVVVRKATESKPKKIEVHAG